MDISRDIRSKESSKDNRNDPDEGIQPCWGFVYDHQHSYPYILNRIT